MGKTEAVKFGTDGWRAVIGENYTFGNVARVSLAVARVFKDHPKISNGIIIGYDTRFLGMQFAAAAAEVFAGEGIKVYLTDSFVSTPTVSLLARDKNLPFGVMITASHNPFKYNGYKLKDEFGGSMSPDEIVKVEAELVNIDSVNVSKDVVGYVKDGVIEYFDGRKYFIDYLKKGIDIRSIKDSGTKGIYDTMFGAGQNTVNDFMEIEQLNAVVNPCFPINGIPGGAPEPIEKNLNEIIDIMKNIGGYNLGIVTDGDADRIAIIDENGDFLDAQKMFALLLMYLHKTKGLTGKVVRSFSTSELIQKYCEKYGLDVVTVPIGFKHISKYMIEDDVMIGAEESGGIGIKGHLPERDGVYNGLMFMEMVAKTGKSITQLKQELEEEFGKYFYKRIDVHTTDEKKNQTLESCAKINAGDTVAGKKVEKVEDLDGYKLFFDNGWVIIRASGTEPLLRFYCETYNTDDTLSVLEKTIENFNL
jgi:phosphomannomutase